MKALDIAALALLVIGGGVSSVGDLLLEPARACHSMPNFDSSSRVMSAMMTSAGAYPLVVRMVGEATERLGDRRRGRSSWERRGRSRWEW